MTSQTDIAVYEIAKRLDALQGEHRWKAIKSTLAVMAAALPPGLVEDVLVLVDMSAAGHIELLRRREGTWRTPPAAASIGG